MTGGAAGPSLVSGSVVAGEENAAAGSLYFLRTGVVSCIGIMAVSTCELLGSRAGEGVGAALSPRSSVATVTRGAACTAWFAGSDCWYADS